jgi:hypothetical protein
LYSERRQELLSPVIAAVAGGCARFALERGSQCTAREP